MAQRLLPRRLLASTVSRKFPQGQWAPLTYKALQTPKVLFWWPNDQVINNKTQAAVDLHAWWCGPCKILGPQLEKMVAKQRGEEVMAKVDTDDNTDFTIK
ncbi:hypothetical protein GHT09_011243 [Marmota monax]|uniref:Thioredoxin domain-containing protein n=1 Tax=Marmota monax TaxID=9995 RepID=A0A834QI76_MARMO|nr:hypothetical protein GHT09_011243 [Marmota monax]